MTPHNRTLEVRPGRITKKLELKYDYDCERDDTNSLLGVLMLGAISESVDLRNPWIALRNPWIHTLRRNPWIAQESVDISIACAIYRDSGFVILTLTLNLP